MIIFYFSFNKHKQPAIDP